MHKREKRELNLPKTKKTYWVKQYRQVNHSTGGIVSFSLATGSLIPENIIIK